VRFPTVSALDTGTAFAAVTGVALHAPIAKRGDSRHPAKADCWALVPDEADQSTWRLPLFYEGDDGPDPGLVAYALGRLSSDAHPTIPVRHAREARARIKAAWEKLHPDTELPTALRKDQEVTFDPDEVDSAGTGVMVAFGITPEVADLLAVDVASAPDGVEVEPAEAMHVTLAYMGDVSYWPSEDVERLAAVLRTFAPYEWPMEGAISGFAVFDLSTGDPTGGAEPTGAAVALVDVPCLSEWRTRLVSMLRDAGLGPLDTHDFTAHVTLAYGPLAALRTLPQPPVVGVVFDSLMLVAGADVWRIPFDGPRLALDYGPDGEMPLVLRADAKRYTFAPLYVPNVLDSHGEWASPDDLQAMVWDYVRCGNRSISIQHVPGTVAGECVEVVSWPYDVEAKMTLGDGSGEETVTLPAGTIYQGIVWEPWAYAALRANKINGISMGGAAWRVDETPPEGD
jgi:2'-5' RNA ligase